jgi:AraC-like DNA-binding protein
MRKLDPVFLRYLVILFLFSVLLFAMFVPVYFYISHFTLKNELAYIYDRFHRGVSAVDAAINAVNNIAILTNRDSRFKIFKQDPASMGMNPVLLGELRGHFNGLLIPHSIIEDAGIIFSKDIILTRQEIFYFPVLYPFYGNYIQCGDLSMDEWLSSLSPANSFSPVQSYTSMGYGSYDGFTYSVQWKAPEGPEINMVYAILPVNKILPLLTNDEITAQSYIRIYDNKKILYVSSGEKWNPPNRSHVLADKSDVLSVFFELVIPESVINSKMQPVKRLMLGFVLIAVFLIIVLSLMFAYKWSEPMRRLLISIDSTKIFRNEYERNIKQANFSLRNYFREVYTNLSKSISAVDTRLENSLRTIEGQASLLREQIFDKALYRGIYSDQDRRLFQSMFAGFPPFFQLALICYDSPENWSFQETAALQVHLINAVKSRHENIFIHSMEGNTIVLLLPLQERCEYWYPRLQELRNSLNQQMDLLLSLSLSGIYEKPPDLPRAWQELQSIHGTSGVENLISVGQIKDIPNPKYRIPINIAMLQMIYNALSNGNDNTACNILAECIADLSEDNEFISGVIFNLLRDMLILLKTENQAILINEEIPLYVRGEKKNLFKKQFPGCFRRIGELIRKSKEESTFQFGKQITDFIDQNLYKPELYSTMVLEHFNISQPTLQKFIKQVSGHTYLSYVETRRLAKARELLAEGESTVQEVSVKCGFSNTNSFYKAFKRFYGFPPSDIKNKPGRT